jgi:hypothetical protein
LLATIFFTLPAMAATKPKTQQANRPVLQTLSGK